MRSLFLVCILGFALGAWADDGCVCQVSGGRSRRSAEWGYTMASTLVDSQTTRINALSEMVDELEAKAETAGGNGELSQMVQDLQRQVEKQERPLCDKKNHASCGRTSGQCISELLVCDNHPDCDNGQDENEDLCNNHLIAVRPGYKWAGVVSWTGCTAAASSEFVMTMTGNKRYDWFPSRIIVTATISLKDDIEGVTRVYPAHGSYTFSKTRLILEPDETDMNVSVECYKESLDVAECYFLSIGDQHECGYARVTKASNA